MIKYRHVNYKFRSERQTIHIINLASDYHYHTISCRPLWCVLQVWPARQRSKKPSPRTPSHSRVAVRYLRRTTPDAVCAADRTYRAADTSRDDPAAATVDAAGPSEAGRAGPPGAGHSGPARPGTDAPRACCQRPREGSATDELFPKGAASVPAAREG